MSKHLVVPEYVCVWCKKNLWMITFGVKQDLVVWMLSSSLKPRVNDVHNNHYQRHKLFLRFKTTQTFKYTSPPVFSNCAFSYSSNTHYSPVTIWSYHTVVKQIMCYLCVWHSKCQCLVWLMDFFWQRGWWNLLVSPSELQTRGTKWMSSCFLSVCYFVCQHPQWRVDTHRLIVGFFCAYMLWCLSLTYW